MIRIDENGYYAGDISCKLRAIKRGFPVWLDGQPLISNYRLSLREHEHPFIMRQRLGLAAALLGEPDLLVLDEPADGLDPEGVRWLRDFLRSFASGDRTVLISSHVLAEVAQTVHQVLIISRGRLVVESSLEDLTSRVGGAVRVRSAQPERLLAALAHAELKASASGDQVLVVHGATSERVGEIAFAAGIPCISSSPKALRWRRSSSS